MKNTSKALLAGVAFMAAISSSAALASGPVPYPSIPGGYVCPSTANFVVLIAAGPYKGDVTCSPDTTRYPGYDASTNPNPTYWLYNGVGYMCGNSMSNCVFKKAISK